MGEVGGVYFEGGGQFEYLGDPDKTDSSRSSQGWTTLGDVGHRRRGRLSLSDGSQVLHDHLWWRQYLPAGGRERADLPILPSSDVAVFGIPDEEFGEQVKAVVQPDVDGRRGPCAGGRVDRLRARSKICAPEVSQNPSTSWPSCRVIRPASSINVC